MQSFNILSNNPTKRSNTFIQFVDVSRKIAWVCLNILWGWRLNVNARRFFRENWNKPFKNGSVKFLKGCLSRILLYLLFATERKLCILAFSTRLWSISKMLWRHLIGQASWKNLDLNVLFKQGLMIYIKIFLLVCSVFII